MKHSYTSKVYYLKNLRQHYIVVPMEVLSLFYKNDEAGSIYNQRFTICIDKKVTWKGGTMSLGNNETYITVSKKRLEEIEKSLGDIVTVELEKDNSKYGLDVPKEFIEVLNQDIEAKNRFEKISLGKQRAVIYLVTQLKSSQKRIEKSIFLLENVKRSPKGKETMRHFLGKDLP